MAGTLPEIMLAKAKLKLVKLFCFCGQARTKKQDVFSSSLAYSHPFVLFAVIEAFN